MLEPATLLATLPFLATLALHTDARPSATAPEAEKVCFYGVDAIFPDFSALSGDGQATRIELFLDGEPCLSAVVGAGEDGSCEIEAAPGSVCRAVGPLALSPECLDQGDEMFLHFTLDQQGYLFDGGEHHLEARVHTDDGASTDERPIRMQSFRPPYGTGAVCYTAEASFE
jgi:hypothetical protein